MFRRWFSGLLLGVCIAICGFSATGVREVYYYNPDPVRARDVALVYGMLGFLSATCIFLLFRLFFRSRHARTTGFFSGVLSLLLLLFGYLLFFLNKDWLSGIPWYTLRSLGASTAVGLCICWLAYFAYIISGKLKPEFSFFEKWIVPVVPIIFLCAALVRFGGDLKSTNPQAAAQGHPNVVVVLLDTVRKDFVSSYGYPLPTTPAFDSVAQSGILFEDAQTVSSWTLPSVVGMLASGLPGKDILPGATSAVLTATTLPEVLRKAGYYTVGVGSNPHVAGPFGVYQRFERFYDGQPAWRHALSMTSLGEVLDRLIPVADGRLVDIAIKQINSAPRPFFLYLHLMGGHAPYRVPEGWKAPFAIPEVSRDIDFPNPDIGVTNEERENLMLRYAARIRYTDEQLSRFLKAMKEAGLSKSTLLLITADHGEEFGEHGDWTHGRTLYREMLQVPLAVSWPGHIPAGIRYSSIVSHLDVAPTILSMVMPNASIPKRWIGERLNLENPAPGTAVRGVPAEIPPLQSWTTGEYKYIRDIKRSQEWLFHRKNDPEEKENLAAQLPELVAAFRVVLNAKLAESNSTLAPSDEFSAETLEQLKSLGYVQ